MVTWGIVALLFTWVQDFTQLSVLRFLLGVAECFFPGAILFLSLWVPAVYRSTILSSSTRRSRSPRSSAPRSRLLIQQHGVFFGLEGWRFMFFGVAIPRSSSASSPGSTSGQARGRQVADQGRAGVAHRRPRARRPRPRPESGHVSMRHAFGSGKVWALSAIYFGFIYGLYALAFFLDDHRGLPRRSSA